MTPRNDVKPRPDWAMFARYVECIRILCVYVRVFMLFCVFLFARLVEGAESILFREKFSDWPEPGRIIKMKGHESSRETPVPVSYVKSLPTILHILCFHVPTCT